MHKSTFAVVVVVVLAGLCAAAYVALHPAPTGTPVATSTTPVADATQASSTPTTTVSPTTTLEQPNATTTPVVEQPMPPAPTTTATGFKTYRNEQWGFSFEYPEDWEVRERAFGSSVSLFNLAVEPIEPYNLHAIIVNITPKEWIVSAHAKMRNRGVVVSETMLNGKTVLYADNEEGAGGPTKNYYILVNNEYWLHLSGQVRQEQAFNRFIESFSWQ